MSSALAARTVASQISLVANESADLPEIRAFVGRSADQVGVVTNEYRSAGRRANPVGGAAEACDSVASAPGRVQDSGVPSESDQHDEAFWREYLTRGSSMAGHADPDGPWVPIGAGVHTGVSWFGAVGEGAHVELTALGDAVNITARLASAAGAGEILVTSGAANAAGLDPTLERRQLELKGKHGITDVVTLRVA
jgi:hypothetical protein